MNVSPLELLLNGGWIVLQLLVFGPAIILSLMNLQRCRGPAILVLLGSIILVSDAVAIAVLVPKTGLWAESNGWDIATTFGVVSLVNGFISLVGIALLIAAAFYGRSRVPAPNDQI